MGQHRSLLTFALVLAITGAGFLAFLPVPHTRAQSSFEVRPIPDEIAYLQLFHHALALKKLADDAAAAGKDRSGYHTLVGRHAGLPEAEAQLLEDAAVRCGPKLDDVDLRWKVIAREIRSRYPYGMYNPSIGPPPPDPRLHDLLLERNRTVLLCRDELRNVLGEEGFARLDGWVHSRSDSRKVTVSAVRRPRRPAGK